MRKKSRTVKCTALFLAATLVMCACGGQSTEDTQTTAEETGKTETSQTEDESYINHIPDWAVSSPIYEVNIRQYTQEGTINAFAEHLDEIKAMGIDIIWLMPIHPISETNRSGELGSYYSVTNYCEVNPEFGTKEDFAALVDLAHEKGMYIMMDWVANHTGWDCEWITEHPEWYTQDSSGNIISPENMGWPDVADLNYDSQELQEEMISCMKYWVENFDIDGFRCDYANGVPTEFWNKASEELGQIKELYMLAEDGSTTSLLEEAFDMNYNWSLYDAMVAVAHDSKTPDKLKLYIPSNYPEGTYTLNFLDNHDKNSYEGTITENFGSDALAAFWTYIYMIPGVPLVYSSDEIGYDHAIAFTAKDTIDWEKGTADYRELLTKLAEIRTEHAALNAGAGGGEINYIDCGSGSVMAFTREVDGDEITVVINMTKRTATADLSEISSSGQTVLLHGIADQTPEYESRPLESGEFSTETELEAWEYWVLTDTQ